MALLYRFTKLNDRLNTGVFTFIVTRSVTRDLHRDATTKDFYYGYHRWALSFSRASEKLLGVYLILRNPSQYTECYADFTMTLLNREHFSRNEHFTEKACKFTSDKNTQVNQCRTAVGPLVSLSLSLSRSTPFLTLFFNREFRNGFRCQKFRHASLQTKRASFYWS